MIDEATCSILALGVRPPADSTEASFTHAASIDHGLELLKLIHFDLVFATPAAVGGRVPEFVNRLRLISPGQKWVLAGAHVTADDEIAARGGGATAVLDDARDFAVAVALAWRVREQTVRPRRRVAALI